MVQLPPLLLQLLASGLNSLVVARYTLTAAYVVCFYDWIISLDQEVAFIYPAPWNVVKCAYLFCRYYPMVTAPFHLWGLLGDHEQRVCEPLYHALYACAMPGMLSAQYILMLRTYAFSGRNRNVLAVLSISFFGLVGVIIWVISKELTRLSPRPHLLRCTPKLFDGITVAPVFAVVQRSGCFAVTDQPTFTVEQAIKLLQGVSKVQIPVSYHIGMISVLATVFDCLNMFVVVWHCVRHGTFGPLGQSVLKQGILVYVVLTALNALTIAAHFSAYLVGHGLASASAFAYILPSALSCRLVLMLRRKASPTETDLRLEHSHMVNEALEMMTMGRYPEDISAQSMSTNAQAQP